MIRVAITGDPDLVDALTTLCVRSGYRVVSGDGFGVAVRVQVMSGPTLVIDTVEGPLETQLEANFESLHAQWNCGHFQKIRALGNRDVHTVRCQMPPDRAEGVLLAIYRSLLQCYPPVRHGRRRWWWPIGVVLLMALLPALSLAQTAPFQIIDAHTGATLNERVFVGLFAPSATGAVAVELPTTLGSNGGFRVDLLNATVSVTKTALTFNAPAAATVGVASAQALASNASRTGGIFINTSSNTISCAVGATAVLNSGITLSPWGVWNMDEYSFGTGAVNCIAGGAGSNLAIQEVQ